MSVISVEPRGAVTIVKIERPPANAMNPELLEEGTAVVEKLRRDPPAAVVLTGIPGYFSAGLDLKVAPTLDADGQRAMVAGINRIFSAWYTAPFPTVAAVTGHAIAGGMILALCCDYRVVGHAGKFGLTEVKVGAPYPAAALAVVQAELSMAAARRLALRAHLIDAATAVADGAFDEQVDDEQVVTRAVERAEELAQLPARAYIQAKLAMRSRTIAALERIAADGDPLSQAWLGDETADAAARTLAG